jgi:hypothetical protein
MLLTDYLKANATPLNDPKKETTNVGMHLTSANQLVVVIDLNEENGTTSGGNPSIASTRGNIRPSGTIEGLCIGLNAYISIPKIKRSISQRDSDLLDKLAKMSHSDRRALLG